MTFNHPSTYTTMKACPPFSCRKSQQHPLLLSTAPTLTPFTDRNWTLISSTTSAPLWYWGNWGSGYYVIPPPPRAILFSRLFCSQPKKICKKKIVFHRFFNLLPPSHHAIPEPHQRPSTRSRITTT